MYTRRILPTLVTLLLGVLTNLAYGEERFFFDLCGPTRVVGAPGQPATAEIKAFVHTEGVPAGEPGVEAWSMGVEVIGASLAGDPSTPYGNGGLPADFVSLETTADGRGVVLAVVVDFGQDPKVLEPETLRPEDSPHEVLRLEIEATVPKSGARDVTVRFRDWLVATGEPVENLVTYRQTPFNPTLDAMTTRFVAASCDEIPVAENVHGAVATLNPCQRDACFKLVPPPAGSSLLGKPLLVSLTSSSADVANTLWLRWGGAGIPIGDDFDLRADTPGQATQTLVVPAALDEEAFLRVSSSVTGGQVSVRVSAVVVDFAVDRVFPRLGGLGQSVRFLVEGVGFERGVTAFFLRHATSRIPISPVAGGTTIFSSRCAELVFEFEDDPAIHPLGFYDIEIVNTVDGATFVEESRNAFELREKSPREEFALELRGQGRYRANRLSTVTFSYTNMTNLDLPPPMFLIEGPARTRLRLAGQSLFPEVSAGAENRLAVLAVNEQGAAGRLSPGEAGTISVEFTSDKDIDLVRTTSFRLRRFVPENAVAVDFDWDSKPTGISASDWAEARTGLETDAAFGDTWGTYYDHLTELSGQLGRRGKDGASVVDLLRFAVAKSLDRGSASVRGTLVDAATGSPVVGELLYALDGDDEVSVTSCALSNSDGEFTFDQLRVARPYTIAVRNHAVVGDATVQVPEGEEDVFGVTLGVSRAATEERSCPAGAVGLPLESATPPEELLIEAGDFAVQFVRPRDPNEKNGPPKGGGRDLFVNPRKPLHFTVYFENKRTATESAQRVEVVDTLPANLDWRTVCFGAVRFGDIVVHLDEAESRPLPAPGSAPPSFRLASTYECDGDKDTPYVGEIAETGSCGRTFISTHIAVRHDIPDLNSDSSLQDMVVSIQAAVEPNEDDTAQLRWILEALDPVTLTPLSELKTAPFAGLLPPNDDCHRGEGAVSFSLLAKTDQSDNDLTENRASIRFDNLDTIQVEPVHRIFCAEGLALHASNPRPTDAAGNVAPGVILRWDAECRADFFTVEIWERMDDGQGNEELVPVDSTLEEQPLEIHSRTPVPETGLYRMSFRPAGLDYGKDYVWCVSIANSDQKQQPALWSFSTVELDPGCPGAPGGLNPVGGACYPAELRWSAAPGATSYAVFVGSQLDGRASRLVASGLTATSYSFDFASDFTPTPDEITLGTFTWRVVAMNANCGLPEEGTSSAAAEFALCTRLFRRGDCNGDGGLDISDAICTLNWLFGGGAAPTCEVAVDSNSDGGINIADATYTLNFLFGGGPEPSEPFPECGRAEFSESCESSSRDC